MRYLLPLLIAMSCSPARTPKVFDPNQQPPLPHASVQTINKLKDINCGGPWMHIFFDEKAQYTLAYHEQKLAYVVRIPHLGAFTTVDTNADGYADNFVINDSLTTQSYKVNNAGIVVYQNHQLHVQQRYTTALTFFSKNTPKRCRETL